MAIASPIDLAATGGRVPESFVWEHKNIYGADRPTKIPRPTGGSSGEPIPAAGLPDEYPHYLKPIPINTRNIANVMRGHLNATEPKLERWLYSTWTANRDAIKYQELSNAVRDGEIPADWIAQWQQDYTKMVNEKLAPQWEKTMLSSAGAIIRAGEKAGVPLEFGEHMHRVQEWIETRGGELIVEMTASQAQCIRATLKQHTIIEPMTVAELEKVLRPMVGLTPNQGKAVDALRLKLMQQGLPQKKIDQQVGNYAAYLHRIRAKRIARTELAFAYNNGMLETMRQSTGEDGPIAGRPMDKKIYTTKDERVCSHCGPLHNVTVGLEETFPGATARLPNLLTPPFHPGCRCTIIWLLLR